jgi:hypothetical protein
MPATRLAPDLVADELARIFKRSQTELELIVSDGLRRGLDPARYRTPDQIRGDATVAYRARALARAKALLADLERQAGTASKRAALVAYRATITAVDHTLPGGTALAAFGNTHVAAVEVLAGNMNTALAGACSEVGTNIATVFARADALEGALGPGQRPLPAGRFIGRRIDDAWRREALERVAAGIVNLDTRAQVTAGLVRSLINNGVTDALTGFVDRAGRRWDLTTYATMVARTTTRETMTAATVNRMGEHGADIVTISSHPHPADECDEWDGNTFSLSGESEEYPLLEEYPPFHGNCEHVVTPGIGNLDQFEAELERAVAGELNRADTGTAPTPPTPAAPAPAPPPPTPTPASSPRLSPTSTPEAPTLSARTPPPSRDAHTADRLEDQRAFESLIGGDPGPDPELAAARAREWELDHKRAIRALNARIGTPGVNYLKRQDSVRRGLREQVLRGDLSLEDLEQEMYEDYRDKEARAIERERQAGLMKRGSYPCGRCHRFKPTPASVCGYCGDDPVTYSAGGDNARRLDEIAFNRDKGYDY